jgi:histone acetyltransferase
MTGEKEQHKNGQNAKQEDSAAVDDGTSNATSEDEKEKDAGGDGDDTNNNDNPKNEDKKKRKADEILEDPPNSLEKESTMADDDDDEEEEEEDTMQREKRQKQEIETTSDGGDEDDNTKKNEVEENKNNQDDNSNSGEADNSNKMEDQDDNSKSGEGEEGDSVEEEKISSVKVDDDDQVKKNNQKDNQGEDFVKVDDDPVKKNVKKDNQDEEQQLKGKKDERNDDDDDAKCVEIENKDTPPEATVEADKNDGNNDEGDEKNADAKNATKTNAGNDDEGDGKNTDAENAGTTTNAGNDHDKETPKSPEKNGKITPDVNDKHNSGNPYDSLKYIMVRNDGKPESLIKLVALKSLFSRQLPKMPRTYIARLVFDRRHTSLVILNPDPATKDTDEEVIGSICYRAFPEMRFAEIAFCAVNASHQVKGYGTKLMNLVKKEGARTGIEYFITYADNYAIGYFKKQGFTKTISMPKGRFQGLIKDYDGGTMMECYVHPSIDFTRIPEMLAAQRKFIASRIRLKAQSHKVVYDPLPKNWIPHLEGVSRANESAARALAVPGMIEAGWTMSDLMATTGQGKDLDRAKNALKSELLGMIVKLEEQQFSWPFREPVDTTEVKDYLTIIKEPIDLLTIDKRVRKGDHYKSRNMVYADLMLMVNNCKLYNEEASTYVQCAQNLETYLKALFAPR